jgi:hypothetical protein
METIKIIIESDDKEIMIDMIDNVRGYLLSVESQLVRDVIKERAEQKWRDFLFYCNTGRFPEAGEIC